MEKGEPEIWGAPKAGAKSRRRKLFFFIEKKLIIIEKLSLRKGAELIPSRSTPVGFFLELGGPDILGGDSVHPLFFMSSTGSGGVQII